MTDTTLDAFLATYADGTDRVVLDIEVKPTSGDTLSKFIVLRYGNKVVVLNPMALTGGSNTENDHLCVDVHSFVDGMQARAGVFGMENGYRTAFEPDKTFGTSHKWPATKLVALLVGEQKDKA